MDGSVVSKAYLFFKYKKRLRLYKRWPCSTYTLNRVNWIECNLKCYISIPYEPCERYPFWWKRAHTRTEKNSDQGRNWNHDLRVRSPPLYQLSYKVRRQVVGTEDVKVTAMNMYNYKERIRLYKRWPCSTYILNRVNWIECNLKC